MTRRGRKAKPIVLTQEQRAELKRLARRTRQARGPAFRARVVLMLAEGAVGREIEQKMHTSNQTICALRKPLARLEPILFRQHGALMASMADQV